jgi:hypothetical protein
MPPQMLGSVLQVPSQYPRVDERAAGDETRHRRQIGDLPRPASAQLWRTRSTHLQGQRVAATPDRQAACDSLPRTPTARRPR